MDFERRGGRRCGGGGGANVWKRGGRLLRNWEGSKAAPLKERVEDEGAARGEEDRKGPGFRAS